MEASSIAKADVRNEPSGELIPRFAAASRSRPSALEGLTVMASDQPAHSAWQFCRNSFACLTAVDNFHFDVMQARTYRIGPCSWHSSNARILAKASSRDSA